MTRLNTRQRAQRARTSIDELRLSTPSDGTYAFMRRLSFVEDGMIALDDEQAEFKYKVEDLIDEYENPNAPSDDCARLIMELRKLLKPKPKRYAKKEKTDG